MQKKRPVWAVLYVKKTTTKTKKKKKKKKEKRKKREHANHVSVQNKEQTGPYCIFLSEDD